MKVFAQGTHQMDNLTSQCLCSWTCIGTKGAYTSSHDRVWSDIPIVNFQLGVEILKVRLPTHRWAMKPHVPRRCTSASGCSRVSSTGVGNAHLVFSCTHPARRNKRLALGETANITLKNIYQKPRGCSTKSQSLSPEKEQMCSTVHHKLLMGERAAGVRAEVWNSQALSYFIHTIFCALNTIVFLSVDIRTGICSTLDLPWMS